MLPCSWLLFTERPESLIKKKPTGGNRSRKKVGGGGVAVLTGELSSNMKRQWDSEVDGDERMEGMEGREERGE